MNFHVTHVVNLVNAIKADQGIPLLAEEGARREPERAKPQERLRRAKRRRRRGGQIGVMFRRASIEALR